MFYVIMLRLTRFTTEMTFHISVYYLLLSMGIDIHIWICKLIVLSCWPQNNNITWYKIILWVCSSLEGKLFMHGSKKEEREDILYLYSYSIIINIYKVLWPYLCYCILMWYLIVLLSWCILTVLSKTMLTHLINDFCIIQFHKNYTDQHIILYHGYLTIY